MTSRSGDQYRIEHGTFVVIATEVGAGLRKFTNGDRDVIWGYEQDVIASAGRGQVLCPWPNRLEDGSFSFAGRSATAPLDEPSRRNAIHGLVRWLRFEPVERTSEAISLQLRLPPQPAYPYALRVVVRYALNDQGLSVETTFVNEDEVAIPIGLGFHPYFAPGAGGLDDAALYVPATTHLRLDERGLPIGVEPADASYTRVTNPQMVETLRGAMLDECFTDLLRDEDGSWRVRFSPSSNDADVYDIWGDENFTHVMCFTGDTLDPSMRRLGCAIEPMTCPPNALHTGEGLMALAPNEMRRCVWGIDVRKR